MPDAPMERPARHTVLSREEVHVDLPADEVFVRLARRVRDQTPPDGVFAADPDKRLLVVQGQWWYRGEYRVTPSGSGSDVSYEIVNVAQSRHWMGPIAGRRVVADAERDLRSLIRGIS